MKINYSFFVCFLFVFNVLSAQHNSTDSVQEHNKNSFAISIGHAHISQGVKDTKTQWLALPSWMMSYNRSLSEKWHIGLHTDIIIEDFLVEDVSKNASENTFIERSFPISLVLASTYKPIHNLGLIFGAGVEYAEEETFSLIRLGIEPNIKINSTYEVIFNLSYDIKIQAYDNWNLGIGIAKSF